MLAGDGRADRAGVGRERKPIDAPWHRHLVQRRIELGTRRPQVVQRLLYIAAGAQTVMHRFERGADQGRMALLFTQQLERRRTVRDFASEFESRHEHDREKAEAQNHDQHEQAARRDERS